MKNGPVIIVEKSPALYCETSDNVVYLGGHNDLLRPPADKLSFGVEPSDGFLKPAAFVPRNVQYVGFMGKAVD